MPTERTTSILIVDDDEQIQRATKSILVTRQYLVLQATGGQQALELIAEQSPDLVILDLMLPDVSGLDVCREARGWYAGPILVLSARGHDRDKIQALDMGADD
ncbi:MAG TPA: response regulator, partial [Armatimonadota bacterium]